MAPKTGAECRLKQHAVLLVRGTVCLGRKRLVKRKRKLSAKTACCFGSGSASVLGAAWVHVKQQAKVKWRDSLSSMGKDSHVVLAGPKVNQLD